MRLIKTDTLVLEEFHEADRPEYVILSHTWGSDEVTLQEFTDGAAAQGPSPLDGREGYEKIKRCCERALANGFGWMWADTCCIDKTNNHELAEAINSMYNWYVDAVACYAYLADVPARHRENRAQGSGSGSSSSGEGPLDVGAFHAARWFTRGWTLQELLAPRYLEFYASDWTEIGTKSSLRRLISDITRIRPEVLDSRMPLKDCLVGERMSWASRRQTTRTEDMAYSLLGLFDVHMPLIYGEGDRAFIRLQQAVLQRWRDLSIFFWLSPYRDEEHLLPIFAPSPGFFRLLVARHQEDAVVGTERAVLNWSTVKTTSQEGNSLRTLLRRLASEDRVVDPITFSGVSMRLQAAIHRRASHGDALVIMSSFFVDNHVLCVRLKPAGESDQEKDFNKIWSTRGIMHRVGDLVMLPAARPADLAGAYRETIHVQTEPQPGELWDVRTARTFPIPLFVLEGLRDGIVTEEASEEAGSAFRLHHLGTDLLRFEDDRHHPRSRMFSKFDDALAAARRQHVNWVSANVADSTVDIFAISGPHTEASALIRALVILYRVTLDDTLRVLVKKIEPMSYDIAKNDDLFKPGGILLSKVEDGQTIDSERLQDRAETWLSSEAHLTVAIKRGPLTSHKFLQGKGRFFYIHMKLEQSTDSP